MVLRRRPWNRLTSRGTVRSSLHGILRFPGEIRRGVRVPHSTQRPCRRAGTTEEKYTRKSADQQRQSYDLPPSPATLPPFSIN
ncbi:hypothetical protein NDU88_005958 [Pleurodeles waltl]|uniref:Uncharacterized protein n=1 Tax=Pleurodeles waltl TaxID=8319 RepID=A0AAV7VPQ8_PLEWA|nr:hypothetical protein NDU88_005958 [Pleurodeles waltl]